MAWCAGCRAEYIIRDGDRRLFGKLLDLDGLHHRLVGERSSRPSGSAPSRICCIVGVR